MGLLIANIRLQVFYINKKNNYVIGIIYEPVL